MRTFSNAHTQYTYKKTQVRHLVAIAEGRGRDLVVGINGLRANEELLVAGDLAALLGEVLAGSGADGAVLVLFVGVNMYVYVSVCVF